MKSLFKSAAVLLCGLTLAGCSDDNPWRGDGTTGRIEPMVLADGKVEEAAPTRAVQQLTVPEVSAFAVTLSKSDGTFTKSWDSVDGFPTDYDFETGEYTLSVSYGDVADEGLNRPCFQGSTTFMVKPDETSRPEVTASLANTIVSLHYTDAFKKYFVTYSATLHSEGHGYNVVPQGSEEMVYLAPGEVSVSLTFTKQDNSGTTIQPVKFNALPRRFYNVTLDVNDGGVGDAVLAITFSDELEVQQVTIDLSDDLMNTPAPEVTADGFNPEATLEMLQGVAPEGLKFNVFAEGGITSAVLNMESANYRLPVGSNNSVDLVQLNASEQAIMTNAGLKCLGLYRNPDQMAMVDFTQLAAQLPEGTHTLSLEVKDRYTRIGYVSATLNVSAVEVSLDAVMPALFGATTAVVTVGYNGSDIQNNLSFKVLDDSGILVDAPIQSAALRVKSRSEAFPVTQYNLTIGIPMCTRDLEVYLYYKNEKTARGTGTINFVEPEYEMQVDAYATRMALKPVMLDDGATVGTVVGYARVFLNGTELTDNLTRDTDAGLIWVNGLSSATQYTVSTSCLKGAVSTMKTTNTVTTETALSVPNGDFQNLTFNSDVSIDKINIGGLYNVTFVFSKDYQNDSSIEVYEPDGWSSINQKTCYKGSSNMNTWYVVPSTMASSGVVTVRSVAYDHNGTSIATSGGSVNTNYYCENAPSYIANRAAGELFLGSYTYDGSEHRTDGTSFASRPASVVVTCDSYEAYGVDNGVAEVKVIGKSGNVISSNTMPIYAAGNIEIPLKNYKFGEKATSLQVRLRSSNSASPSTKIPTGSELDEGVTIITGIGVNRTRPANSYKALSVGSVMKISNVKANY